jgi:hypothetical protein
VDLRVAMTVSRRPHYLRETLDLWGPVRGLQGTRFTFHVEPLPERGENLRILGEFGRTSGADVEVVANGSVHGVLHNPWTAFEWGFQDGADFMVLVEEDTPVSTDVLEYFRWVGETYRGDPEVLGACAWSDADYGDEHEVVSVSDFCPLVWGIWADSWTGALRDTWDHDYSSSGHPGQCGWDWNIRLRVIGERKFLFPRQARSTHIGVHGQHCRPQDFAGTQARSWVHHRPPTRYQVSSVPVDSTVVPWPI